MRAMEENEDQLRAEIAELMEQVMESMGVGTLMIPDEIQRGMKETASPTLDERGSARAARRPQGPACRRGTDEFRRARGVQVWRMHSMALVRLRGPLKALAGGAEHPVEGATVAELLRRARARRNPRCTAGSSTSAAGSGATSTSSSTARRAARTRPIAADDRVDVLPAISGGAT